MSEFIRFSSLMVTFSKSVGELLSTSQKMIFNAFNPNLQPDVSENAELDKTANNVQNNAKEVFDSQNGDRAPILQLQKKRMVKANTNNPRSKISKLKRGVARIGLGVFNTFSRVVNTLNPYNIYLHFSKTPPEQKIQPSTILDPMLENHLPEVLIKATKVLINDFFDHVNFDEEKVFSKEGSLARKATIINQLVEKFNIHDSLKKDIYAMADSLKELTSKLEFFKATDLIDMSDQLVGKNNEEIIESLKAFIGQKVLDDKQEIFQDLIGILANVADYHEINSMSADDLAHEFAPLLYQSENSLLAFNASKNIVKHLIVHCDRIFSPG